MRVSIVGSGYVGTTIAACFADLGHEVINIDIDEDIVETVNSETPPIHEDGLPELVAEHAGQDGAGRLRATTEYDAILDTDATFLCLPTPQNDDGSTISRLWKPAQSNWGRRSKRQMTGTLSS